MFEDFNIGGLSYKEITKEVKTGRISFYDILDISDPNINRLKIFFDKWIPVKTRGGNDENRLITCISKLNKVYFYEDDSRKSVEKRGLFVKIFFPIPLFGHSGFIEFSINEYEDGWFTLKDSNVMYLCDQISGVEKLLSDKYLKFYTKK
jgi:hypothetical protein